MNQEFELNSEPLWAMPAHVRERIGHYSQKSDYNNYCHRSVLTVARALVLDRAASRYHHDGTLVSVPVPFRWRAEHRASVLRGVAVGSVVPAVTIAWFCLGDRTAGAHLYSGIFPPQGQARSAAQHQ